MCRIRVTLPVSGRAGKPEVSPMEAVPYKTYLMNGLGMCAPSRQALQRQKKKGLNYLCPVPSFELTSWVNHPGSLKQVNEEIENV